MTPLADSDGPDQTARMGLYCPHMLYDTLSHGTAHLLLFCLIVLFFSTCSALLENKQTKNNNNNNNKKKQKNKQTKHFVNFFSGTMLSATFQLDRWYNH